MKMINTLLMTNAILNSPNYHYLYHCSVFIFNKVTGKEKI